MRLEDICKVFTDGDWIESKDQSDEGIRLVQTGNIGEGKFLEKGDRAKYISEKTFDSLKCTEIFPGDILVSRLPEPVGRACIIPEKEERMITAVDCTICRPDENMILKEYLCYFMQSEAYYTRLMNNVTGTTRKRISRKNLGNVELDIPDKETQAAVVKNLDILSRIIDGRKEELDKLDELIKTRSIIDSRQHEIDLLDELIKARFVELFGDPLDGTAKYPIHQVGDVAEAVDPQPSHRTPPVEEGGIPYVSIKDCDSKTGMIDFEGARKVSRKVLKEHLDRYTLHEGDFVIGKIGTIGNPIFVPARNDYTLSANVVLVQPNTELVSAYYLKYAFESAFVERQFSEAKNSTSQAAFGIQKVRTIEVMNPDIEIQRGFESFAKQVDKSKVAVQTALDETQTLFDSLMQEYFG